MIYKKISVRKTATGYSIHVFVRDGDLVKPLYAGIQRFFDHVDKVKANQTEIQVESELDDYLDAIKEAKVVE